MTNEDAPRPNPERKLSRKERRAAKRAARAAAKRQRKLDHDRAKLKPEALEPRILLSATWVDADTDSPIPNATDGDDIYYGSTGDDTADGLGGSDQMFGSLGDDTLDGGGDATAGTTTYEEDFSAGATGWSDNTTTTEGSLGTFLGKFAGSGGAEDVSKTFTFGSGGEPVTVSFDFHRIDSWDNENFNVFVNGNQIFSQTFAMGSDIGEGSGSAHGVDYTITATSARTDLAGTSYQDDQTFRIELTFTPSGSDFRLGFGSTLDSITSDEAYGIGNLQITGTGAGVSDSGDLLRGGAGNDKVTGDDGLRTLVQRTNAFDSADNGWSGSLNQDAGQGTDYGWQSTNVAGGTGTGEAGGDFARTGEPTYYADNDIGTVTLDEDLSFTSRVTVDGSASPNGGIYLGYRNADTGEGLVVEVREPQSGGYRVYVSAILGDTVAEESTASHLQISEDVDYDFAFTHDASTQTATLAVTEVGSGNLVGTLSLDLTGTSLGTDTELDRFGLSTRDYGTSSPTQFIDLRIDDMSYTVAEGNVDATKNDWVLSEDFANDASGWSNDSTYVLSQTGDTILGRFTGNNGVVDTEKTFTLPVADGDVTVTFDGWMIDTVDGSEHMSVFVNDVEYNLPAFHNWTAGTTASGGDANVSWTVTTPSSPFQAGGGLGGWSGWYDNVGKVELTLHDPGTTLKLGFDSNLGGGVGDESYGIGALEIRVPQPPAADDTLEGGGQSYDLGDLRAGVASRDDLTGTGYMLFSVEDVHDRFSPAPNASGADHFVTVQYDEATDKWMYATFDGTPLTEFIPRDTDILVAELDYTNDTVTSLQGTAAYKHGILAGYADGDLVVTPNAWNGGTNTGEFGLAGTFIDPWLTGQGSLTDADTLSGGAGNDTLIGDDLSVADVLALDPDLSYNAATGIFSKTITAGDLATAQATAGTMSVAGLRAQVNQTASSGTSFVVEFDPNGGFDDTLTGGAGDDTLEGGIGLDRAVFTGNAADYTVTQNPDGTWTVADNVADRDGTDTLTDIEVLVFADQTYAPSNLAPFDLGLDNATVDENSVNGTVVGQASATELNLGDSVTYNLIDDAGGRFAIDETTGEVTVADGALLDYETSQNHDVVVRATDSGGLRTERTFTIQLVDRNDAPTAYTLEDAEGELAAFNFTGSSDSATSGLPGAVVSDLVSGGGSGFTADASEQEGRFRIRTTDNSINTAEGKRDNGQYVAFTVEAEPGQTLDLSSFSFDTRREGNSPDDVSVYVTSDGGASFTRIVTNHVVHSTSAFHTVTSGDLSGNSALQGLDQAEFRIVFHAGNTSITNGVNDLDNVRVLGSVDAGTAPQVNENAANGTVVANLGAVDQDAGDTHTFALVDNPLATIASAEKLTFTDAEGYTVGDEIGGQQDGDTGAEWISQSQNRAGYDLFRVADEGDGNRSIQSQPWNSDFDDFNWTRYYPAGENALADGSQQLLSFDLRLDGPAASNDSTGWRIELGRDRLTDLSGGRTVNLEVMGDGELRVHSGDGTTSLGTPGFGSWMQVAVLLDYDAKTADLYLDGTKVADGIAFQDPATANGFQQINFGTTQEANYTPISVRDIAVQAYEGADADGRFAIDSNTGEVTVADGTKLDAEADTTHDIVVRVTDDSGATHDQTLRITVNDLDDNAVSATSDADATANAVAENATNGTVVGITALATDADNGATVTYSLADDADGRFTIDANTGVVTVADASKLDHETDLSHTVTVEATSSDGDTTTEDFVIDVTAVDEGPSAVVVVGDNLVERPTSPGHPASWSKSGNVSGHGQYSAGNSANNGEVWQTIATEPGKTYVLQFTQGIVGTTTKLQEVGVEVTGSAALIDESFEDRGSGGEHVRTLTFTADSTATELRFSDLSTETVGIDLLVSRVDVFETGSPSIAEDAANGTAVATVLTNDADADDTHTFTLTDDAGGRFAIDANGVITVADTSLLDHEQFGSHDVTVQITDAAGLTDTQTITVQIEDATEGLVHHWKLDGDATDSVGHLDGTGNGVAYTAPGDGQAAEDRGAVLDGNDFIALGDVQLAEDFTFAAWVWVDSDAEGSQTIFANTPGGANRDGIRIFVNTWDADDGKLWIETGDGSTQRVVATGPGAITDDAWNHVIVSVQANGETSLFVNGDKQAEVGSNMLHDDFNRSANARLGALMSGNAGLEGRLDDVRIYDQRFSNAAAPALYDATFDDAPTDLTLPTSAVAEDAANGTVVGTLALTDPDPGDTHSFALTDDAGGRFAVDANGAITVADATLLDHETDASHDVTVRVTDAGGNTYDETFTITVDDVNDAPTDLQWSDQNVLINGGFDEPLDLSNWATWVAGPTDVALTSDASFDIDPTAGVDSGPALHVAIADAGTNQWEIGLSQGVSLESGRSYTASFTAWTDDPAHRSIKALVFTDDGGWQDFGALWWAPLTNTPTEFSFEVVVPEGVDASNAEFRFEMGGEPQDVFLDAISLTSVEATVAEDAAPGTYVGTARVADPDAGDSHRFHLTDNDGRFGIGPDTGEVVLLGEQSPDDLPGLIQWLDASDAGTRADANSDDRIENLADKSGNGHDASGPSDALKQPRLVSGGINGHDALAFFGNDEVLKIADDTQLNSNAGGYAERLITAVIQTNTNITDTQVIYEQGGLHNGFNLYVHDGKLYAGAWSENDGFAGVWLDHDVATNTAYVVSLAFDGNAGTMGLIVNGQTVAEADVPPRIDEHTGDIGLGAMNQDTKLHLGDRSGDDFYFDGLIGEFAQHAEASRQIDALELQHGLMEKWSFDRPALDHEANASHGISVRVTDAAGATYDETFTIAVTDVNEAPTVDNALADQSASEDTQFSYQFASDAFGDVDDGDSLTYTATLANGDPLPTWLSFDDSTRTFSGTPANDDVGTLSIRVTATDDVGETVSDDFDVIVANTNDAPTVDNALADQNANEDQPFSHQFAADAFGDDDLIHNDALVYTATLANGDPLPDWLTFDPASRTFSGTPENDDIGAIDVRVTATDFGGAEPYLLEAFDSLDNLVKYKANVDLTIAAGDGVNGGDALHVTTEDTSVINNYGGVRIDVSDAGLQVGDTVRISYWAKGLDEAGSLRISHQSGGDNSNLSHSEPITTDWQYFEREVVLDKAQENLFFWAPDSNDPEYRFALDELRLERVADTPAQVSDEFTLTVANTNDAPTVDNALVDQNATEDAAFSYQFASDAFGDVDAGDTLDYTATLANGDPLPSWLSFDASTRTFSGTPTNDDVGAIDVRVTATDDAGASISNDFALAVANTNDTPTDLVLTGGTISEAAAAGDPVGSVAVTDADAGDTHTYALTDDAGGRFAIDNSGQITVADASLLDYEADASHDVTVRVTDAAGASYDETFTLAVTDANDAPADLTTETIQHGVTLNDGGNDQYLVLADASAAVPDLTEITASVTFAATSMPGSLAPLMSYAVPGEANEFLMGASNGGINVWVDGIDWKTGVSIAPWLDGEPHTLSVSWDGADGSTRVYVDGVEVASRTGLALGRTIDAGGALVFGQEQDAVGGGWQDGQHFDGALFDARVYERIRSADAVADDQNATSPDRDGLTGWWDFGAFDGSSVADALGGGNDLAFGTIPSGGAWSAAAAPALVNVTTPNGAPAVAETAADGDVVTTVTPTDDDPGDTHIFALTDDAGGRFAIDTNTGEITVADASRLDHEAADTHNITVRVTDAAGATYDETFTIAVNDVNEAPTVDTALADQTATEETAFAYQFSAGTFGDVDNSDTTTYTATLANGHTLPDWLSFDPTTRTFQGTPDNTDVHNLTIRVTATDADGLSVSDDFALTVNGTNDGPELTRPLNDVAATEDVPLSHTFADDHFWDPDHEPGTPIAVGDLGAGRGVAATDSRSDTGYLMYSAESVHDRFASPDPHNDNADHFIAVHFDNATGQWLYDDNDGNYTAFTPRDTDVLIAAVDFGANTAEALEGELSQVHGITAGYADGDLSFTPERWTGSNNPGEFQINGTTFTPWQPSDTLAYTATLANGDPLPSWLSFDTTTRTFSGTPANGDVGAIDIRITATDGAGAAASDDFTLTVANVNDTPTVDNALSDQNATEDAAFSYQFASDAFGDIDDIHGDTLDYAATLANGDPLPAWLSFDPTTRTLTGTPSNDDVGTLDVRVTATDDAGATVTDDFVLAVVNTNDAPTVDNALADQNATEDAAFSYQFASNTFGDADAGDTLTYTAGLANGDPLPTWLSFDGNTRTFTGTPDNDHVGTLTVRITATDNAGVTVTDDFALAVANVNDTPDGMTLDLAPVNLTAAATFTTSSNFNDGRDGENLADGHVGSVSDWSSRNETTPWVRMDWSDPVNLSSFVLTDRALLRDNVLGGTITFSDGSTETFGALPTDQTAVTVSFAEKTGITWARIDLVGEGVHVGLAEVEAMGHAATPKIVEDAPDGTVVGTVLPADVDAGDTHTFALLDDADGRFAIDANTGELTVVDGSRLDHEADATHTLRVEITDAGGETHEQDVTIDVLDRPEAVQTHLNLGTQNATEDAAFSYTVPNGTFSDPDGGTLTYETNGLPPWLTFDAATQTLSGTPTNVDVDTFTITIVATDDQGYTAGRQLVIAVADTNDAPVTADTALAAWDLNGDLDASTTGIPTLTVSGNTPTYTTDDLGNPALDFSGAGHVFAEFNVPEHEFTLTLRFRADQPDGGIFDAYINGNDRNVWIDDDGRLNAKLNNEVITSLDRYDDGQWYDLTYTFGDNVGGQKLFVDGIEVASGNETASDKSRQTDIRFGNAATADRLVGGIAEIAIYDFATPDGTVEVDALANRTTAEGDAIGFTLPTDRFVDTDDDDTLTLSVALSNGDPLPTWLSYDAATQAFSGTPPYDAAGAYEIEVTATDNDGAKVSESFTLLITNTNLAPDDLTLDTNTVAENAANGTPVGTVNVSDPDAGDTHTFALLDDANGRFAIDANTGEITVADGTQLDHENAASHTLSVRVTDAEGAAYDESFTLIVDDVNEAATAVELRETDVPVLINDGFDGPLDPAVWEVKQGFNGDSAVDVVGDQARFTGRGYLVTAQEFDPADGGLKLTGRWTIGSGADNFVIATRSDGEPAGTWGEISSGVKFELRADHNYATIRGVGDVSLDEAPGNRGIALNDGDSFDFEIVDDGDYVSFTLTKVGDPSVTVTLEGRTDSRPADNHVAIYNRENSSRVSYLDELQIERLEGAIVDGIEENVADGTEIARVQVTDADAGDSHTFALLDDADGRFAIDPSTGVVTVIDGSRLDHEAVLQHTVRVEVTDAGGLTFAQDLTIAVDDINESPETITWTPGALYEGTTNGTVVGVFNGRDPDAGDSLTFELIDDADGRFVIDPNTGELRVVDGNRFDFEDEPSVDVIVRVEDTSGLTHDELFTLDVLNRNEAPTGATWDGGKVPEHSPSGTLVGRVLVEDADLVDSHTFALLDDAGGRFSVDSATGEIRVARGDLLDLEQIAEHDITVRITDAAGNTLDQTLTVQLTDVTEAIEQLEAEEEPTERVEADNAVNDSTQREPVEFATETDPAGPTQDRDDDTPLQNISAEVELDRLETRVAEFEQIASEVIRFDPDSLTFEAELYEDLEQLSGQFEELTRIAEGASFDQVFRSEETIENRSASDTDTDAGEDAEHRESIMAPNAEATPAAEAAQYSAGLWLMLRKAIGLGVREDDLQQRQQAREERQKNGKKR